MKKNLLAPHSFKKIGWIILTPAAILGLMMWINDFNGLPSFLLPDNAESGLYKLLGSSDYLLNNIALIGTILGALFITCSREKIEDEMIGNIRLNALLLALYINFGCVIVAALIVYDMDFINVMIYSLIGLPLLFLMIFEGQLWRLRKEADNAE